MNTFHKVFAVLIFLIPFIAPSIGQCDLRDLFGEFDIPDNRDTCLSVTFSDIVNDDLSQNIIFNGIAIEFEHDAVSDLVIDLTSPAGQTITMVGDINGFGSPTTGAEWNVLFAECSGGVSPDSGISDTWDNDEPWVIGGNYTGTYYPANGCFEDFNMGSANGEWTLCIRDGLPFNSGHVTRIEFALNGVTSANCNQCSAEAGSQSVSNLQVCTDDDMSLDLGLNGENTDSEYSIVYLVSQNNVLTSINLDADFTGLTAGSYDICAISILEDELSDFINTPLTYSEIINGISFATLPFCIDISSSCTAVDVFDSPSLEIIDRTICLGDQVIIGGEIFNTEGSFPAILPKSGTDLCDTSVLLNLEIIEIQPNIQASANAFTCNTTSITLDASSSLQESGSVFLWSTNNGSFIGDPSGETIEITEAGTYILEQSENGCTRRTFINIGVGSDIPQINITSAMLTCTIDEIMLTVNSSSNIFSAEWEGPGDFTSSEIEPLINAGGLYSAAFTDITGCTVVINHEVLQDSELPTAIATAPNLSCTVTSVPISLSNTTYETYRWTGPQGFVSNIAEPEATTTGVYFLEMTDASGCKGFTSLEIFGDIGTFEYEITGENFLCSAGRVTISASTEANNAVYSWTGPNNFFSSTASNSITTVGTYYIEIIANGCTIIDSIDIQRDVSDLPEYEVDIESIGDCQNPVWRLTAVPIANEFQTSLIRWGLAGVGIIGTGASFDVTSAGTYFLRINTFNGCAVTRRFTIDPIVDAPDINLVSKTQVTCTNGPSSGVLSVTENPDYSYEWSSSSFTTFTSDTSTIENLDPGFYDLTVTDINSGCVSLYSDRINGDTIPRTTSIRNTDIDCENPAGNIILDANGDGNSYSWEGPGGQFSTKDISVMTAGMYFVTVTGGNGCVSFDSVSVIQDTDPPILNILENELECETQSLLLDPNNNEAGVTYSWEGPNDFVSTAATPVVFATGQYGVTLTGLNACTADTTIQVFANSDTPTPFASVNDTLNCIDTTIMIFSEASVPIVSYRWDGPGTYISTEQNPSASVPGEYILTVTSEQGCIAFDTVEVIEEIILPEINYAFDGLIDCRDITSELMAFSSDPGATFTWIGPNNFNQSGQNAIAHDPGTYYFFIRGSNNCVAVDTFRIEPDATNFTSTQTINCYEPSLDISELSDSLTYEISWAGPNDFFSEELSPEPLSEGVYNAFVLGSNSCITLVDLIVQLDTINPAIGIQQNGRIKCEENIISLDATGSAVGSQYTYSWTSSDGIILSGQDSFANQIEGIGNYQLTVFDSLNGCTSTLIHPVMETEVEFLDIEIQTENPRCFGENNGSVILLGETGGIQPFTYSLDGNFFTDMPLIEDLSPGDYTYIVKDSFGCVVTEDFTISETEALELELGDNLDVFLGNEVEIVASTNLSMEQIESIRWQIQNQLGCSDCLSFTLTPDEDLLIELTIMNERGCTITDEVKVIVDQDPVLFKPNIFSPNDDGFNDVFFIFSNPGVAQINSLAIYDRWGNKVFSNANFSPGDVSAGWDGRYQGKVMQAGVYVYKLEVEMITGATKTQNGSVTLFK